jgi:hypothetical protein
MNMSEWLAVDYYARTYYYLCFLPLVGTAYTETAATGPHLHLA